jgi:sugar (pentulose or hexulose) kinase
MKGVLTVDVGTTSLRAILYDAGGNARHIEQRHNPPDYLENGRVEQDPRSWQSGLVSILRGCREAAGPLGLEPVCIAATAQRSSVLPVDAAGTPLHPAILWQDTRSAGLVREMAAHDARVHSKTGLTISPVFSAVKMRWLRENRPEVWRATHKLLGVQDWVLFQLSGRFVTDHSFASRTNLFDLRARRWDPDMLALFGVPERMLCDLVAPGAVVGGLTPAMAAQTGLAGGLPVVSAGGDQQCAALGLGLFAAGRAVANTGTGSYLVGHADAPVLDAQRRVSCNVAAVPGAYIVEAAMLSTGAVHRWLRELLAHGADDADSSFETLDAEAARAPAGCNGLVLLPDFKGAGSPDWDPEARGALVNLHLGTTRGEIVRAILEGIAFKLAQGLEVVEELCGPMAEVHAAGGLTRSALFDQIQSDVFERPVSSFGAGEATSQGAWIAGAVATGLVTGYREAFALLAGREPPVVYHPNPATRELYRLQRRRARAVYDALAAPQLRALFR